MQAVGSALPLRTRSETPPPKVGVRLLRTKSGCGETGVGEASDESSWNCTWLSTT
jgi:hypothetical protein